ncbi:ERAP1-like C-terminal domain-containing protein, partial [Streptomyces hainanensis]
GTLGRHPGERPDQQRVPLGGHQPAGRHHDPARGVGRRNPRLRQLVTWLGEDAFLAGINTHFARHRFGNATLADFIDAMAEASGRPVHEWADAWLRTTGPDTLTPEVGTTDGAWRLTLHHSGGRPHRLRLGVYDATDERHLTPRGTAVEIELPAAEGTTVHEQPGARPDLLIVNDGDLSYAKVRLDPASWATARRALGSLPDPLSRTVVWNAARDMVRDGELDPEAYLDAARRHLPGESAAALLEGVIGFARHQIADQYLPAERRTDALLVLTELAHDMLGRTADGTDPARRLIAVRTAIGAATDPDALRAWWAAGSVPGGPELDPELRWQLLHRLAVLGATDQAEIDAEARRDPSATGEEGAARCRAALPEPAAKAAAWEAMFDPADRLSNYLFIATAQGFWHPEQRALLTDYVPRYYPEAAAMAARRGHSLAVAAGRHAFPHALAEERTLRLGEAALRDTELTTALRRSLADQLDDLRRALAARERQG